MENNKTDCCEDVEFTKKVIKDKNISFNENEPGEDEDNGNNLILEAESGCGCGCGAVEYPDQSRLDNPPQPKYMANSDFILEFENYARSLGIKSMGYAQLTPELLIVDKFIQYPHAMVLTMEMSKEIIETAPGEESQRLNDLAYEKLTKITYNLSDYLRKNGFATEVLPPLSGIVNFSALAEKAGLGCRGKNGLLITPELGSRVKISTIFVSIANLPLKKVNEHNWIPDYCQRCANCIKNCPEKALVEKEGCCGDKEIELIVDKCIGCSEGCTFCIEECPFVKKGYGQIKNKFDKINAKLKEKQRKNFDRELWEKWAQKNSALFKGLADGATIAVTIGQNEEQIILLEKKKSHLNVTIKDPEEVEPPIADIMLNIDENKCQKILKDDTYVKLKELIHSGKINVYALIGSLELIDKGYMALLSRLGIIIPGGGGCC